MPMTTPHLRMIDTTVDLVNGRLEKDLGNLLQWFKLNYFKPNLERCHLLLNNSSSNLYIKVCGKIISNSKNEKLHYCTKFRYSC